MKIDDKELVSQEALKEFFREWEENGETVSLYFKLNHIGQDYLAATIRKDIPGYEDEITPMFRSGIGKDKILLEEAKDIMKKMQVFTDNNLFNVKNVISKANELKEGENITKKEMRNRLAGALSVLSYSPKNEKTAEYRKIIEKTAEVLELGPLVEKGPSSRQR